MKWTLSIFAAILLAFCLPGFAQSNSSNSNSGSASQGTANSQNSTEYGTQSQQSGTANQQSGMQHQNAANGNEQSMEGCIVRENTYYYLVPEQGARVRLNGSSQVAKNEGHHVRVRGRQSGESAGGNENGSSGASASNSGSMSQGGNANGGNQEFVVDKIQSISATCPGGTNGNGSPQR